MIERLHRQPELLGAVLIIATFLLYGQVWNHEFLAFDDASYVTNNPHVNTGYSLENVVWAFTTFHEGNWHPLTWLSHMFDSQLFGVHSGPHHMVNVALHGTNALLLFLLLRSATGAVWRSWFVAALLAVHPLNVETTAWVAQRKSLLCALLCLVTMAAYGLYVRRRSSLRYLSVVCLFAMALMAKPMAVTLPLVLLLLDYWPLGRDQRTQEKSAWWRLVREKTPLFVLAALSSWITLMAQSAGGAIAATADLPVSTRFANAITSYCAFMAKTFWPAKLAVFYPYPEQSMNWQHLTASSLVLIAITVTVLRLRSARYLLTGWLLFLVVFFPVIGVVQVGHQSMADRYAYFPCIGLFIMFVWGTSDLVENYASHTEWILPIGGLAALAILSACTIRYLNFWTDGVRLFTHASIVAERPDPVIEEALADSFLIEGHYDQALPHYREACFLQPGYALCHFSMGEILYHQHQLQDALREYQLATELSHDRNIIVPALINSGEILIRLGNLDAAEQRLIAVQRIDRSNPAAAALRAQIAQLQLR